MKLLGLSIRNFRCFGQFVLDLSGESVFLIGENGSGKTTLLEAVARGIGRDRRFSRTDFRDLAEPLEIVVTLGELSNQQRGAFADDVVFARPVSLTLGIRAVWDPDQEAVDVVHGFPRREWRRTSREQRECLSLEWLPSARDIRNMLQLGRKQNLMGRLVEGLAIGESVDQAATGIADVRTRLSQSAPLRGLLEAARGDLASLAPGFGPSVFSLGSATPQLRNSLES